MSPLNIPSNISLTGVSLTPAATVEEEMIRQGKRLIMQLEKFYGIVGQILDELYDFKNNYAYNTQADFLKTTMDELQAHYEHTTLNVGGRLINEVAVVMINQGEKLKEIHEEAARTMQNNIGDKA